MGTDRGSVVHDPMEWRKRRTFTNLAARVVEASKAESVASKIKSSSSSSSSARRLLAQYLRVLAKLASDIPLKNDERLLRENIHRDHPLHPRRTLDQYYFPTLEDTTSRDRGQVVYRATKRTSNVYDDRGDPRLVMVDQLWLWILDDSMIKRPFFEHFSANKHLLDTVISSFPTRWGQAEHDTHKALRLRFEDDATIRSVYHLGANISQDQFTFWTDS